MKQKDYTEEYSFRDFNLIAEYIDDELETRKRKRSDLEKEWKEIDRQLAMIPDIRHKMRANGQPDKDKAWMPETELPLQSQTLEILVADANRMTFPDSGTWFNAHAQMTDTYLRRADLATIITGDENEVPSLINQDNADKLVIGIQDHWMRQYDFRQNVDLINAEAFKYSVGVGRGRLVTKQVFMDTAKGVVSQKQEMPMLYPVSIKNTYLDDRPYMVVNEGQVIGPAQIFVKNMSLLDLKIAANNGSTDPEDPNGGWIPSEIVNIKADKHGDVQVAEYEGDLVVPRDGEDVFIPNAIATIAVGKFRNKVARKLVRLRYRKTSFSSYVLFPYHREHVDSAYATSPLLKGWPIQKAASEALNWLMVSAALNVGPPVQYDSEDMAFVQSGGPQVYPFAKWGSTGDIKPHEIGDPAGLFNVYAGLLTQYADVTGTHSPRLGAQTLSHTTAFAKEAELARGTVRTVDYVKASLNGPLLQWLYMSYAMGRSTVKKDTTFYINSYNGHVTIDKSMLPDEANFEAYGSGGPSEEQAKQQQRYQALQFAMQLDQLKAQANQMGYQSSIDFDGAIQQVLMEGKWTDIDTIYNPNTQQSTPPQSNVPTPPNPQGGMNVQ